MGPFRNRRVRKNMYVSSFAIHIKFHFKGHMLIRRALRSSVKRYDQDITLLFKIMDNTSGMVQIKQWDRMFFATSHPAGSLPAFVLL
jgi:hypothetical protein